MQAQAMRACQITFLGRNAEGKLPMFTRICAMTGKGAVRAFTERYQPVSGWFLGDPEDITDKVNREAEDTGSYQQR